jgi:hypothetical protein
LPWSGYTRSPGFESVRAPDEQSALARLVPNAERGAVAPAVIGTATAAATAVATIASFTPRIPEPPVRRSPAPTELDAVPPI